MLSEQQTAKFLHRNNGY